MNIVVELKLVSKITDFYILQLISMENYIFHRATLLQLKLHI